jgi:hypothetical protein
MDQRVSIVTTNVADVQQSRAFSEALGCEMGLTNDIVMFQTGEQVSSI